MPYVREVGVGRVYKRNRNNMLVRRPIRSRSSYTKTIGPNKYGGAEALVLYKPVPRNVSNGYMRTERVCTFEIGIIPNAGIVGGAWDLGLQYYLSYTDFHSNGGTIGIGSIPQVTEFTNLFDEYRIRKVNIELFNSQQTMNTPAVPVAVIHMVNDSNSTGSFNMDDLKQYPNLRSVQIVPGKPAYWSCYPSARSDVLTSTGVTSSSALKVDGWIDTSSPTIRFLGTRFYISMLGLTTASTVSFTLYFKITYDLEFRNVK